MLHSVTYLVQIHAIITRSHSNRDIYSSFTPDDILTLLQTVNQIYAPTGIAFHCDRETDIEYELDPIFNQESAKELWQYRAMQHPGKLVLYFTDGDAGAPPAIRNYTYIWQATGDQQARQLAHELGHYFHLEHTFVAGLQLQGANGIIHQIQQWFWSQPAAKRAMQNCQPVPPSLIAAGAAFLNDLLDGDKATIEDTPATLHEIPDAELATMQIRDSAFSLPIPVQLHRGQQHTYDFQPDMTNLMCYGQGSGTTRLSRGQIRRIHQSLLGDRRHLLTGSF